MTLVCLEGTIMLSQTTSVSPFPPCTMQGVIEILLTDMTSVCLEGTTMLSQTASCPSISSIQDARCKWKY